MAAQEQDLTAKIAMSLDEIIGLNQQSGGEGSPSNVGGDGDREGGRPFRRGRRFPRGSDKPYPRASSPSSSGSVTNRVYVGNLSWQTSWQDLKDHMRSAGGTVIHADVFLDEYGRSKGCGIVEYATREEALHAIQTLNDTKIGDSERLIFVREDRETNYFPQRERGAPRGRRGPGPSPSAGGDVAGRQVFVRNLPFSTSWQDLKDYFKQFGRVVRAEALTNTDGTPKGQGTVLFETREDAQNAIARANNTELQGRIIGVQEDRYVA